jgi:hypothetical protein
MYTHNRSGAWLLAKTSLWRVLRAAVAHSNELPAAVRSRFLRTIRTAICWCMVPQMKTEQKSPTAVSINGALLEAAKSEAHAHGRSLSSQLEIWIEQSLETAGKRKPKSKT